MWYARYDVINCIWFFGFMKVRLSRLSCIDRILSVSFHLVGICILIWSNGLRHSPLGLFVSHNLNIYKLKPSSWYLKRPPLTDAVKDLRSKYIRHQWYLERNIIIDNFFQRPYILKIWGLRRRKAKTYLNFLIWHNLQKKKYGRKNTYVATRWIL